MAEAFINARPRFRIDGTDDAAMAEAVKDVAIQQPLSGRAHAELRLINWGRVSGSEQPGFVFQQIRHGAVIEIMMGEQEQQALFSGDVTAIEERYGDGAPQLLLLVEDKMHLLARQRHTRRFEQQSLDDVLQALADDAGLSADIQVSSQTGDWHQFNESNLAFMQRLLAPYDIAVRWQHGRLRIKPEQADSNPPRLSPQDGMEYLRIIADLNGQPTNSHVTGFDLAADEATDAQSDALQPAPSGTSALEVLNELGWPGEAYFPHPFAKTQAEADKWATGAFRSRAKSFLAGDAVCTGNVAFAAGREVELTDVSERLRGRYQIVHCSHRFDSSQGFRSFLKLNRADWSA
ncbi:MAG: phage late control D family protein [Methylomonas sp.]|jgi:phage protein D|uniref:phage late control D family protein n=1 Tax=Methylomonas sp. TaxID=418 RepID=UPI0025FAE3C6|nr:phage late control D family protein [Methylomonas sp.]MCK9605733.1 phage late control D family protein [Methylomonas sp.]